MSRFCFDFDDTSDEEGLEFNSPEQACEEAVKALPLIIAEKASVLPGECGSSRCIVREMGGKKLFRITMALVVEDLNERAAALKFKPV